MDIDLTSYKLKAKEAWERLNSYKLEKDPEKLLERDATYLVTVDGQKAEAERVDEDMDDLGLYTSEKDAAKTSVPLEVGGLRLYFTKPGYQGTMALHRDTLLTDDVYSPAEDDDGTNGTIEDLSGSKKTQKVHNEAKRERELLKPDKADMTKLLLAIGAGVGLGMYLVQSGTV